MRIEPGIDMDCAELAFDAQTSGGLLIATAADSVDQLVQDAIDSGAEATTVIGEVIESLPDIDLVLRP